MSLDVNIETYTHLNNESPFEVLLVGIPIEKIGSDNRFEPPDFHREHITTWLMGKYLFLKNYVYAQIPMCFNKFPEIVQNSFDGKDKFIDVCSFDEDKKQINIYYITQDNTIVLKWDYTINYWSMDEIHCSNKEQLTSEINNQNIVFEK